jgi:hypothetical protein
VIDHDSFNQIPFRGFKAEHSRNSILIFAPGYLTDKAAKREH